MLGLTYSGKIYKVNLLFFCEFAFLKNIPLYNLFKYFVAPLFNKFLRMEIICHYGNYFSFTFIKLFNISINSFLK